MAHRFSPQYRKQGLPPGTPRYTGQSEIATTIRAIDLPGGDARSHERLSVEEAVQLAHEESLTWIDVRGLASEGVINELCRGLGIHPLAAEDVLQVGTRPKVELFDRHLLVILKMVHLDLEDDDYQVRVEHVPLVLGRGFVVSFQEWGEDPFDGVRRQLLQGLGGLRRGGSGRLVHALIDAVVDDAFEAIEELGRSIEDLEERLLENPPEDALQWIQEQRTVTLLLRRAVRPVRDVLLQLRKVESDLLPGRLEAYWNDVDDHVVQVLETLELYREMVMGMVELYHTSASARLNDTMRVLTLISVLFLPLSFLTGLYGMNFVYMPELQLEWGYFALLGVMVAIAAGLAGWFRWRGWL